MSYLGYPFQIKQVSNIELEGDYIKIPQGTTTQRDNNIPLPESGMLRFNSTENSFEGYNGTEWDNIGQVTNIELEGDYIKIPQGTTTQRDNNIPFPESGMMRFNSTENSFEGYNGSEWGNIGGGFEGSYTLENSTVQTIYFSALPFYLSNGNFSPICLKAGVIPFLLADGVTEIEYKVN